MKTGEGKIADEGACGVGLIQRIAVNPELDTTGACAKEGLEDHGESGFSAMHAGVEEADCLFMVRFDGLDLRFEVLTGVICLDKSQYAGIYVEIEEATYQQRIVQTSNQQRSPWFDISSSYQYGPFIMYFIV